MKKWDGNIIAVIMDFNGRIIREVIIKSKQKSKLEVLQKFADDHNYLLNIVKTILKPNFI